MLIYHNNLSHFLTNPDRHNKSSMMFYLIYAFHIEIGFLIYEMEN